MAQKMQSKEITQEMVHVSAEVHAAEEALLSTATAAAEQSDAAEADLAELLASVADEKAEQAVFDRGDGLDSVEECLRGAIRAQLINDAGGMEALLSHDEKQKLRGEEKSDSSAQSHQMDLDSPTESAAPASTSRRGRSSRRGGSSISIASMSIDEKVSDAPTTGTKTRPKRG